MSKADNGLRALFKSNLPTVDWLAIENSVSSGAPDHNGCVDGKEFWIEYKATSTNAIKFRPNQPAWIHRRVRHGGRVWIAIRHKHDGGVRLGKPVDDLILVHGEHMLNLVEHGVRGIRHHVFCGGDGPIAWDWALVLRALISEG